MCFNSTGLELSQGRKSVGVFQAHPSLQQLPHLSVQINVVFFFIWGGAVRSRFRAGAYVEKLVDFVRESIA